MAKRRVPPDLREGVVPAELLDPDAACWASRPRYEVWAARRGIDVAPLHEPVPPPERLAYIIGQYAVAAGHTDPRNPDWPDRTWLRESGLWETRRRCRRLADQSEDPRVRAFGPKIRPDDLGGPRMPRADPGGSATLRPVLHRPSTRAGATAPPAVTLRTEPEQNDGGAS